MRGVRSSSSGGSDCQSSAPSGVRESLLSWGHTGTAARCNSYATCGDRQIRREGPSKPRAKS